MRQDYGNRTHRFIEPLPSSCDTNDLDSQSVAYPSRPSMIYRITYSYRMLFVHSYSPLKRQPLPSCR